MAGESDKKTWSSGRWLGAGLLVMAVVVLFLPDRVFGPFGVLVFVGLLVAGIFLVTGLWGTPADVIQRRRQQAARPAEIQDAKPIPIAVAPRVFRYRVTRLGLAVMALMGMAFVIGGLALLALLWRDPRFGPGSALATGGFLIVFGLLVFLYLYRWTQIGIWVDSTGIKALTLFTRAVIPWQDVVALKQFGMGTAVIGMVGRVYRVYSSTQTLEFYDSLVDAPELITIIAAATAQTWE